MDMDQDQDKDPAALSAGWPLGASSSRFRQDSLRPRAPKGPKTHWVFKGVADAIERQKKLAKRGATPGSIQKVPR